MSTLDGDLPGSKPGERRGGRQLGTRNKANLEKNEALESALRLAFAKYGSAYIRTLTPAQFQFLAMHEAIEAGFIYSALAIADKVAPYYDARLAPLIVEPPAEPEEAKAKRLHVIASQPDSKGRVHDDLLQTPVSGCEGGHLGGGGAGQRGGAYVQIWRHSYEATVVAHSGRVGCRWSADGTLIHSRRGLLRVARPNDGLNWDQAAVLISPNISDRSCNRAR
jgi:hypothetical protein